MGISREAAHETYKRAIRKLRDAGAAELLGGLAYERQIARRKPVSTFHAARAHVFARREA